MTLIQSILLVSYVSTTEEIKLLVRTVTSTYSKSLCA